MDKDEIIEMANQSQLFLSIWIDDEGDEIASLVAFAKLVAAKHDPKIAIADAYRAGVDSGIAAEREACAKEAEDSDHVVLGRSYHDQLGNAGATAKNIAVAIRNRGEA